MNTRPNTIDDVKQLPGDLSLMLTMLRDKLNQDGRGQESKAIKRIHMGLLDERDRVNNYWTNRACRVILDYWDYAMGITPMQPVTRKVIPVRTAPTVVWEYFITRWQGNRQYVNWVVWDKHDPLSDWLKGQGCDIDEVVILDTG